MAAITINDLNNAKLDVDHIAALATSTEATATDRLGNTKFTIAGAIAEFPNASANASAAAASAAAALSSEIAAAAAGAAALIQAGVYATEALGRAAVADGAAFKVQGDGDVAAYEYRRTDSANSVLIASYPSASAVKKVSSPLAAIKKVGLYRDAITAPWGVVGKDGKAILFVDTGLALNAAKLKLMGFENTRSTGSKYSYAITDLAGNALLGFSNAGEVSFLPSAELAWRLNDAQFADADLWRGTAAVSNIRSGTSYRMGAIQDPDGRIYDAAQLRNGSLTTAVVRRPTPLRIIAVGGQSNSGQGGAGVTLESEARFPGHVLQFSGAGKSGLGYEAQSVAVLTDFEAANDPLAGPGQFVATMLGFAIEGMVHRDPIIDSPGFLMRTDWHGGAAISSFLEGSINYTNTMQAMSRAVTVAAQYGRTVECPWYVWIQGESGPSGRATYAAALTGYIDTLQPDLAAAVGQAAHPKFVIVQTNTGDYPDAEPGPTNQETVNLAQWDVSLAKAADGVILAGPMYQCPMILDAMDNIHLSSIGRMVLADTLACIYEQTEILGEAWAPLRPASVVRNNNLIDITFDVPAGSLAWDTDWIAARVNYGFSYVDSTTSATISSVAITSANTVRITLSATPTGSNKEIRYAIGSSDFNLDTFASGRGQLISPTSRDSYFFRQGFDVPATVNHYAIKFTLPV